MQCPDKTTLSAYSAGELPPREWSLVDKHFQSCEVCHEHVDGLHTVHQWLTHHYGMKPETDAVIDRILKGLDDERQR